MLLSFQCQLPPLYGSNKRTVKTQENIYVRPKNIIQKSMKYLFSEINISNFHKNLFVSSKDSDWLAAKWSQPHGSCTRSVVTVQCTITVQCTLYHHCTPRQTETNTTNLRWNNSRELQRTPENSSSEQKSYVHLSWDWTQSFTFVNNLKNISVEKVEKIFPWRSWGYVRSVMRLRLLLITCCGQ